MKSAKWAWLTLLLAGTVLAGQVYKWKDADGRIHYSDTPPPAGGKVTQMPMHASEQPVSAIVTPKAPPIGAKSASEAAAEPVASAPAEKDPKLCQQARARKAFLQTGQLMKTVNEKGEVEFMNPQKRDAEIAEADKAIGRFCP